MTTIDVDAELAALVRCLEASSEAYHLDPAAALVRMPSLSGWSVAEHFYHLCLATDLALRNVQSLVRGKGRLITAEGGPNELAREVLSLGTFPRGKSHAPRMVQPPDPIDPALLLQELGLLQESVVRTRAILGQVVAAPNRIPHQRLGNLDAGQWLRFARLHAAHHLAIISDLVGARPRD